MSSLIVNSDHFKGCSDDLGLLLKTIFLVVPPLDLWGLILGPTNSIKDLKFGCMQMCRKYV